MPKEEYFVSSYSVQIINLVRLILRMKLYTSKILQEASIILSEKKDIKLIKSRILELESKLKKATIELEDSVNKIIALSHPVAFDLRFLLSSIKLSSELGYIANWVKKTIHSFSKLESNKFLNEGKKDLLQMLDVSLHTLKDVISTLLQFDSKKKADREILNKIDSMLTKDDIVDELYEKILQEALNSIKNQSVDPIMMFEVIGIAKNLEKVSDCIHNMIITTRYVLTGKRL